MHKPMIIETIERNPGCDPVRRTIHVHFDGHRFRCLIDENEVQIGTYSHTDPIEFFESLPVFLAMTWPKHDASQVRVDGHVTQDTTPRTDEDTDDADG